MDVGEVVGNAIQDIGLSWFTYLSQSLIFGLLMVLATVYIYDHGLKPGIQRIINLVKGYTHYRYLLAFYLYIYLMAIKTIFSREAEWSGWSSIMGDWWFYYSKGELNCNWVLNYLLFIPFGYLLLKTFPALVNKPSLKEVIKVSLKFAFMTSLGIEVIQLVFSVGTFQLADLCYNTLSGMTGGLIYGFLKSRNNRE